MSGQVIRLKHQRIADELAEQIRAGQFAHGARLPGEHALAARFAVSRTTVRQALTELGRRGLISTHSGKGSFVTFDGRPLDDRLGWARALAAQGVPTTVRVLRLERVHEPELAERFGLPTAEYVAVDRLRSLVDGPAISIERSRIPATGRLRDLPDRGLTGSLYAELHAAGLVPAYGEEWVELTGVGEADAELLGCVPGKPYLHTRRLSHAPNGDFVEHVESLLDPERFRLRLRFGEWPA
ncbi:GntR family transcriptional regulator [Micromonospora sp. HM5-17]|jgi:GntR family transcriptional regulator|uniref:GntR family transcriptional regulator n=1 Tax=Micromonospora sp. HM5-17 TaxID=2487710 RepID=UPI000F4788CC|nr:GntR family transcriptional regulator [Micromonospora sp. HM5-17]ROT26273.1 GntR family transcriptional regulator [Micromonospora sp. HM5-17]